MVELDTDFRQQVAIEAARAAGAHIRRAWQQTRTIEYKGPVDLVTPTDRESEAIIADVIRTHFPDDMLIAEEATAGGSLQAPDEAQPAWYVDPLDGTVNFAHGVPHFAVSVAFAHGTSVEVGVVYDPMRDELFFARRHKGAWLNGKRITVSVTNLIERALLATGFPYDRQQRASYYVTFFEDFLRAAQDVRRYGSAALDLAWVAAGRYDGFWEWRLHPWDVAAGSLIVTEAGGIVSTFSGRALPLFGGQIVATNPALHAQMCIRLINRLQTSGELD